MTAPSKINGLISIVLLSMGCGMFTSGHATTAASDTSKCSSPAVAATADINQAPALSPSEPPSQPNASQATVVKPLKFQDWLLPHAAAEDVDKLAPNLEPVRIVSETSYIPSRGLFTLLVFKSFVEKDNNPKEAPPQERLGYRAFIVDTSAECQSAAGLDRSCAGTVHFQKQGG